MPLRRRRCSRRSRHGRPGMSRSRTAMSYASRSAAPERCRRRLRSMPRSLQDVGPSQMASASRARPRRSRPARSDATVAHVVGISKGKYVPEQHAALNGGMTYSKRVRIRRTGDRPSRPRRGIVAALTQLLPASSSSTAASPIDVLHKVPQFTLAEGDGALPGAATIFDDEQRSRRRTSVQLFLGALPPSCRWIPRERVRSSSSTVANISQSMRVELLPGHNSSNAPPRSPWSEGSV